MVRCLRCLGCLWCLVCLGACSNLPAQQEKARAERVLAGVGGVVLATVECGGRIFASDEWCAEVIMKDGAKIRFARVGFNSFGGTATNVIVDEAGGLVPRVASCSGVGPPNFHRESALGHHFHPTLIDLREAVSRYREVMQEVQWWPQCPQYFEAQDKRGQNVRYCARRKGATEEPPRPENCR
jgi:hypothetical protein